MNNLAITLHWFSLHPLSAAALVFGGASLAVVLYTYVHDYRMLANEGTEEWR